MISPPSTFLGIVSDVAQSGRTALAEELIANARRNAPLARRTIKQLPPLEGPKAQRAIVISAGPSLRRRNSIQRIRDAQFDGTIVAVEASYAACLREGLVPDVLLTLDAHRTRMIRWFGDPNYEENSARDNYFQRQDLDVAFRENALKRNQETIDLINRHGPRTRVCVSSSSPENVVARIQQVGFETYWWNPLVDDPRAPDSLTRTLHSINRLPCMNTGGNVGTAAWVLTQTYLKVPKIAVVGMDLGYYADTPYNQTQMYYEYARQVGCDLSRLDECFVHVTNPYDGESYYTDPTYYWYGKAFTQLLEQTIGQSQSYNCTEGGVLIHPALPCIGLDAFLKNEV